MDLSPANQAALLLRFNATFPGESFHSWERLPFTKQQYWRSIDPQAAAVAAGELSAEQHAALLVDGMSPEMPSRPDARAEYEARLAEVEAQMAASNAQRAAIRAQREAQQRKQGQYLNSNAAGRLYY